MDPMTQQARLAELRELFLAAPESTATRVLAILLSLVLGSVVHHIPTAQPHKCMLLFTRLILLLYACNNWLVQVF